MVITHGLFKRISQRLAHLFARRLFHAHFPSLFSDADAPVAPYHSKKRSISARERLEATVVSAA